MELRAWSCNASMIAGLSMMYTVFLIG